MEPTESLRLDRAETKDDLSSDDVENIPRDRKERIVVPHRAPPVYHPRFIVIDVSRDWT